MKICLPEGEERQKALRLAAEQLNEETGRDEKKSADGVLAFLNAHTGSCDILACTDEVTKGILVFEPETFRIILLITAREYRHQGIASALLDDLKERAAAKNAVRITVNAAGSSIGFYERYGFEKTGPVQEAGGHSYVPMEYLLQREFIGKTVTVTVDRPYGSFHPHRPDLIYQLNFGYVDELISRDGEFQDAWIIGPEEPLETFRGIVAGIIYHKDGPSRFIVTRPAEMCDREKIMQAVAFEEQFYETRFVWNRTES